MRLRRNKEDEMDLQEVPFSPVGEAPQLPDPSQLQILYYPHIPEEVQEQYRLLFENSKLPAFGNLNEKDFKFLYSLARTLVYLADIHTIIKRGKPIRGNETPAYNGYLFLYTNYINMTRGRYHEEMKLLRTSITRIERSDRERWKF